MTVIKADEDFQPVLTSGKDFEALNGAEEINQWIRIQLKQRLFNITSDYQDEDIPNKIKLALSRIPKETDYIDSVEDITVQRLNSLPETDKTGYKVSIAYNGSEQYQDIIKP